MKSLICMMLSISVLMPCLAQTSEQIQVIDDRLDSLDLIAQSSPRLEIGGNYVSLVSYNGRTEGIEQYGLSPSVTAHFGKGWSLSYEGAVWSAANPKYAFSSIGLAKKFEVGESFEGSIGYSRWLFHTNKAATNGDFGNIIDLETNWNIGDFTFGNTSSVLFGTSRALFLQPSLTYEWSGRFGKARSFKWSLKPSVTGDYGNDVPTKLGGRALVRAARKSSFKVLNYDAALAGSLAYKKTDFSITYHYDVPVNTVAPNPVNPFSYWEVSFIQTFGF
jgi:hypothetical protein